jgi:serine/threonine-protein kinase
MQVARGLNAAHRLGMIHRDLKPDNIFLTTGDEGELIVKVVDFGIAKLRESASHTLTGTVLGTPAYMSAEQASGMPSDELDARSDVYSLGIVVYEMLSGRVPFHSATPIGYLRKHMLEPPPPFRAVAPGLHVPPQVEAVVMKALDKQREERYASALEFARAFAAAAHPAPAPEPSPPPGSSKFVLPSAAREPAAPMRQPASALAPAHLAVQTPPPASVERILESPSGQPQGRMHVAPASHMPAVAPPPQFQPAPEPSGKMKFVALAVVALILIVAAVWYFSSGPPPVVNPTGDSGASHTGTGQPSPAVNPAPPSPTESDTNAADRRAKVEAAKRQGDIYSDNGEYNNAINAYQEGLKLDPSNPQLLQALQSAQTAKAAEEKFNH